MSTNLAARPAAQSAAPIDIASIALAVRNLDQMLDFYRGVVGSI